MQSFRLILPCVTFSENLTVQLRCSVNKMSWRSCAQREWGKTINKKINQRQILQSPILSECSSESQLMSSAIVPPRIFFFPPPERRNQMMSWWASRCCTNKRGSRRHQKQRSAVCAIQHIDIPQWRVMRSQWRECSGEFIFGLWPKTTGSNIELNYIRCLKLFLVSLVTDCFFPTHLKKIRPDNNSNNNILCTVAQPPVMCSLAPLIEHCTNIFLRHVTHPSIENPIENIFEYLEAKRVVHWENLSPLVNNGFVVPSSSLCCVYVWVCVHCSSHF